MQKLKEHLASLWEDLPSYPKFLPDIRRAPKRELNLSSADIDLAIKNALRYIPKKHHAFLYEEFKQELLERGRIYGYRFRPEGRIFAKPLQSYEGHIVEAKAMQVMIDNNLDFLTALYPYELVTYGETGQVFQNWMQYHLVTIFLQHMNDHQTLVVQSGHPLGLFQSSPHSPRVIITNAMMVGMYDNLDSLTRAAAIGVANYGQMTAGGWMYIGPQGIVHGTFNTLLIAARLKLNVKHSEPLKAKIFVSSGLGGMSGAQGKAAAIGKAVGVIAEVDPSRVQTRYEQKWVDFKCSTPKESFDLARMLQEEIRKDQRKSGAAIAYQGNILDLLQYAVDNNLGIDLLSDQTSCHAVYDGGYCPQGMTFEQRTKLINEDKKLFKAKVDQSLRLHFQLIKKLVEKGTYFFDYGNSFMKSIFDAGVQEIAKNGKNELDGFIWPSYVEDILGPELFDFGYGPFRWVCLSGEEKDLDITDQAAADVIRSLRTPLRYQDIDNLDWVVSAKKNNLVVGSKARILYQDAEGRVKIALKFNELIRHGIVGPIMLGRDHHDTSGTDSPFRETSNIKDGSQIMADMSVQCFAGNAARGMSLVALHNGGGVGIGRSFNGGFGLVLDGSSEVDEVIRDAVQWDVMCGVSRRAWARNKNAIQEVEAFNKRTEESSRNFVLLPHV